MDGMSWLTGLFEGEGTTMLARGRYFGLRIYSTDLDLLARCGEVAQAGQITGPYYPSPLGQKGMYYWNVTTETHALRLVKIMFPYLSQRRRAIIRGQLAERKRNRDIAG